MKIRIFVNGLKFTHTLATHVYEKGPQTLADTKSEVEILQAVQQLTATLLPSSTVNVMSHEECFIYSSHNRLQMSHKLECACAQHLHILWSFPPVP